MTISFFIPGEAVPQLRPRIIKKGKHMGLKDPEKTKNYKAYIRALAAEKLNGNDIPTGLPVRLYVRFYMPIPRSWSKRKQEEARAGRLRHTKKPDLDNLLKAVKDALTGLVWHDDSQIYDIAVYKQYSDKPGVYVQATITE